MYKTKLQELCHRHSWNLPVYAAVRDGPDHNSRFRATVSINGISFETLNQFRSSKEAQNQAAKLALDHFADASNPRQFSTASPLPSSGHLDATIRPSPIVTLQPTIQEKIQQAMSEMKHEPAPKVTPFEVRDNMQSTVTLQPTIQEKIQPAMSETKQEPAVKVTHFEVRDNIQSTAVLHLYKNRLQTFAQKRNIPLPMYSFESEGPPHASRFRSKVTVGGQTFESLEFFSTLREAEHAAAKVAYESLSPCEVQEDDTGLYKNLLQEFSQRKGLLLPKYDTAISGPPHMATFVSTVEVGGQVFQGKEAKIKKQAEMSAAKVAYTNLLQQNKKQAEMSPAKVACTNHQESQPTQSLKFLSSRDQLKEALEISSSVLQSIISTGELPQNSTSKPDSIISKEQDKDDKDASQERCLPAIDAETRPLHHSLPSPEEETDAKRHRCSSPSDFVYAHQKDPSPATSAPLAYRSPSPSSQCSTSSVMDFNGNPPTGYCNSSSTKVVVYPRNLNNAIPEGASVLGASVLPYSDDKWVAVKMDTN